jgi:hypothetical protein
MEASIDGGEHAPLGDHLTFPGNPEADRTPIRRVSDIESWRRANDQHAPWFDPRPDRLHPSEWARLRQDAGFRTVATQEVDVLRSSEFGPERADGRRILRLDRIGGAIRYEVRRMEVRPGRWVREFTVPLRLDGDASPQQKFDLGLRAWAGMDELVNRGYRLPGGDQLHVRIELNMPRRPSIPVAVSDPSHDPEMTQNRWPADATGADMVHEVLHFLGLRDEYLDRATAMRRHQGLTGVHDDNGLMVGTGDGFRFLPRYSWIIERVSNQYVAFPGTRR